MSLKLTDIKIDYHRNGVAGNGFHVCLFKATEGKDVRNHMAVLFDEPGSCAVFDTDFLAQGNITFGENSWRGDHFEGQLRKAIEKWHQQAH